MVPQFNYYNIFLDDYRSVGDVNYLPAEQFNIYKSNKWEQAVDYPSFKNLLYTKYSRENAIPKAVSFDHDLMPFHYGLESYESLNKSNDLTGYHAMVCYIEFLNHFNLPNPNIIGIHTMSKFGFMNMEQLVKASRLKDVRVQLRTPVVHLH